MPPSGCTPPYGVLRHVQLVVVAWLHSQGCRSLQDHLLLLRASFMLWLKVSDFNPENQV